MIQIEGASLIRAVQLRVGDDYIEATDTNLVRLAQDSDFTGGYRVLAIEVHYDDVAIIGVSQTDVGQLYAHMRDVREMVIRFDPQEDVS